MTENAQLFTIKTRLEKEDYRRFLYFATFKKQPFTIIFMIAVPILAALCLTLGEGEFNVLTFALYMLGFFALFMVTLMIKIDSRCKARIRTDKIGAFNTWHTLVFYEDSIDITSEGIEGNTRIKYSQFYKLIESKDYFMLYVNSSTANLIRKKDLDKETAETLSKLLKEKIS